MCWCFQVQWFHSEDFLWSYCSNMAAFTTAECPEIHFPTNFWILPLCQISTLICLSYADSNMTLSVDTISQHFYFFFLLCHVHTYLPTENYTSSKEIGSSPQVIVQQICSSLRCCSISLFHTYPGIPSCNNKNNSKLSNWKTSLNMTHKEQEVLHTLS